MNLCSDWTRSRTSTESRTATAKSYMVNSENWVGGYLSGVSSSNGINFLRNADSEAIFSEIDIQCRLKPSQSVADAADSIVKELLK